MASLKSIKKRIVSVKNTRQITKAMKMVSAAKLRRAQENVVAARPYAKKLGEVLGRLAKSQDGSSSPLLQKRISQKALLVVVTSDRGLCGGFNANICKAAERFIREKKAEFAEISVTTVGRKGFEFLKNRQKINKNYGNVLSNLSYPTAALLAQEVVEGYVAEEYDEVYLLFNAFRSVMSQDITLQQLLPIVPEETAEEEYVPEYIYEPSKGELLDELLPKHIEVQVFKALLESVASEHGARMTAMDSASKNATEMIGKLTLQYNRARQAAITTELMEIISGAESIKG
ncbi:ATP synthase F1 subunit gamma [Geobacter hydrogenophilus]|uniref:ATP synthase gamma chain n=1 Tax=Geobacter hydrogenophilus TaxID=40983 RepID=A0A9W6FZV3_9BACT|nr:ATP synthase F1 subunit gamma [Geobacter hydrogenophilus]MBT0893404.1 ATP synthase F1 subunit gamma [Geobacter hydrogenophilus]GLI37901.1 ATP synthase gamma chain [Geobacter hydrogenophilus]